MSALLVAGLLSTVLAAPVERGVVVGQLCWDLDGDGACGVGEPPAASLPVVASSGERAVADVDGRFHLRARAAPSHAGGAVAPLAAAIAVGVDLRALGLPSVTRPVEVLPFGATLLELALAPPAPPAVALPALRVEAVRGAGEAMELRLGATLPDGARLRPASGEGAELWLPARRGRNERCALLEGADGARTLLRIAVVRAEPAGRTLLVPEPAELLASARVVPGLPGAAARWDRDGRFVPSIEPSAPLVGGGCAAQLGEAVGAPAALLVSRLELEAGLGGGLVGRGGGTLYADAALPGGLSLIGGVALDERDVAAIAAGDASALLAPREGSPLRPLDPRRELDFAGDAAQLTEGNPGDGRLWGLLAHEHGQLRLGTIAPSYGVVVGRFEQPLFGAHAALHAGEGPLRGELSALAAPALEGARPLHEELVATGGSLYFLGSGAIVPGSERIVLERRDPFTGLVLERRRLGADDYELDAPSGRLLLVLPPSLLGGGVAPGALRPGRAARHVLVIDALERELVATPGRDWAGGGARVKLGDDARHLTARAHLVQGRGAGDYGLVSGGLEGRLGPLDLALEAARSEGALVPFDAFRRSVDGGLSREVLVEPRAVAAADSLGATLRLEGGGADVTAQAEARGAGASDDAALATLDRRSARLEGALRLASLELDATGALVDGPAPFSPAERLRAHDASIALGVPLGDFTPRLLGATRALARDEVEGGAAEAGLGLDWRASGALTLRVEHLHSVWTDGAGQGAEDATFSGAGATVAADGLVVEVRGGGGPRGPELAGSLAEEGPEARWIAGSAIGRDATATTGARASAPDGTAVWAEDGLFREPFGRPVAGRAFGLQAPLALGLSGWGRVEQAELRDPSARAARSAASAGLRWGGPTLAVSLRGERWTEARGTSSTLGRLAGAELSTRPTDALLLRLHALVADATGTQARLTREEAGLSGALRLSPLFLGLRATLLQETPPAERFGGRPYRLWLLQLAPALALGRALSLGAGLHAGLFRADDGARVDALALSARPALRPWGPLEVALEAGRRSTAPDGGALHQLRAELGLAPAEGALIALGYHLSGYAGSGVDPRDEADASALYLRASTWF